MWQPKTAVSESHEENIGTGRDDDEWKEWNEALANATEEELVDLAGMQHTIEF